MDPNIPEINNEIGSLYEGARNDAFHGRANEAQAKYQSIEDLMSCLPAQFADYVLVVKMSVTAAQVIDGLRALADFLDRYPNVPVNSKIDVHYSVIGNNVIGDSEEAKRAEVDRVAAVLGVTPEIKVDGGHYTAVRAFGPVEYSVTAITDEWMAKVHASDTYYGVVTP
ncbi:hypothetical protein ACIBQ1_10235 [Nonomuraea sp. NPDC050153]|uniref:hypothetical protein n=1 Tax=Nonomuraea sp. NPDC050153 TaxID=3364359 RepID=UPI0037BC009C